MSTYARPDLIASVAANITSNNAKLNTATKVRAELKNLIDSAYNRVDDGVISTVDTIADLKDLNLTDLPAGGIQPLGYYAAGDGGGGPVRILVTGSAGEYVDDGGSVILPTGGDGSKAWVMEYSGPYNVKWFGAYADNSHPGETTAAFQAALDKVPNGTVISSARGGRVYVPDGDYQINAKLTLQPGTAFHGDSNEGTRIHSHVSNDDLFLFTVDGTAQSVIKDVAFRDFSIIGEVVSSGAYIRITCTATSDACRPSIENVYIYGRDKGAIGVRFKNTIGLFYRQVVCQGLTGTAFKGESTNNAGQMVSTYAFFNGGYGYDIVGTEMSLTNTAADGNILGGYRLQLVSSSITSLEGEANGASLVHLLNCEAVSILTGYLHGAPLTVNGTSTKTIDGITIDGGMDIQLINVKIVSDADAPTGYTIKQVNSPARVAVIGGLFADFTSGGYNSLAGVTRIENNGLIVLPTGAQIIAPIKSIMCLATTRLGAAGSRNVL